MNRLTFLFFIFLSSNLYLAAQVNNTINNSQVFVLGIKELDSLVCLFPNKKISRKKVPIELLDIVVEKRKMKDFCSIKKKDFKYASLDTNCYISGLWYMTTTFVHECIIPLVSEKDLPILYKTYPKSFGLGKSIYDEDVKKYNKKYKYCNIVHHKFILVLIHAPLYNYYCNKIRPAAYRLRNDKAEQGIYFKVLIPIDDIE